MSQSAFKAQLLKDKVFLKELYESDSVTKSRRILNFASDVKLNTLIKYIHFVSNGVIKMKKSNFAKLDQKHIMVIKKNFEAKAKLQKLLKEERSVKILQLNKFLTVFPDLLTPLFKRMNEN